MKKTKKLTKKKKKQIFQVIIYVFAIIGVITTICMIWKGISLLVKKTIKIAPSITEDYLTVNEYSRPGIKIDKVNGIVIHYVANPGSDAKANRDYFENLRITHKTKASSHFVIGLDGEILQIIPLDEMSYASNSRNGDTISIECCHQDSTGKFNSKTYDSLVHLTAWLCGKYNLTTDNVIRHYDVTGKMCPKYYVDNEDEWLKFKKDVDEYIFKHGV